jgi:F-type H+-transporting ATPase subunit b
VDEHFFILIATVLFVVLTFRPISKAVTTGLDKRSQKIKEQLDEAENLRIEAEKTLIATQKQQKQAIVESDEIIASAHLEAKRLEQEAKKSLELALNRREQMAFTRIAYAEKEAMSAVKNFAVDLSIKATEGLLEKQLSDSTYDELLDASFKDIGHKYKLN